MNNIKIQNSENIHNLENKISEIENLNSEIKVVGTLLS